MTARHPIPDAALDDRHYAMRWRHFGPYYGADVGGADCPVCGLSYVPKSAEDRKIHRSRHRAVLQIYEPKPDAKLAALRAEHGVFVPVGLISRAHRNRLEGMARMFKRELGFDFPPFSTDDCNDRKGHHWMIVAPDGRAIGGFGARWCEFDDAPPCWLWTWAWVIPAERRHGHMGPMWAMLKSKFPHIEPETPLSYPVAKFFANRDDVPEVRGYARREVERGS